MPSGSAVVVLMPKTLEMMFGEIAEAAYQESRYHLGLVYFEANALKEFYGSERILREVVRHPKIFDVLVLVAEHLVLALTDGSVMMDKHGSVVVEKALVDLAKFHEVPVSEIYR